jgi:hypothetical protein
MLKTTRKQREALFKIFQRDFPGWHTPTTRSTRPPCPKCGYSGEVVKVPSLQYRAFLRKCVPEIAGWGAVMVPWRGMWLGVEQDGHVHS